MRVDIRILVLILGGKHSAFHYYVWYQLLIFLRCSTRLKTLTCIPSLLRLFNQEGVLDSVKCFLCIYRDDHMTWFLVSWNQPWIIMGRTDPVAEAPILWPPDAKSQLIGKDPDAGKYWRQKEKGATEDEMVRQHHDSMDMNLSKLWEIVKDREAWRAAIHGVTKSWPQLSN